MSTAHAHLAELRRRTIFFACELAVLGASDALYIDRAHSFRRAAEQMNPNLRAGSRVPTIDGSGCIAIPTSSRWWGSEQR